MAGPVGHSVELDAMGELHLVLCLEPLALLLLLLQSALLAVLVVLCRLDACVVVELVAGLANDDEAVGVGCPSSVVGDGLASRMDGA